MSDPAGGTEPRTVEEVRDGLGECADEIEKYERVLADWRERRAGLLLDGRHRGVMHSDLAAWARVTPAAINKALSRARAAARGDGS